MFQFLILFIYINCATSQQDFLIPIDINNRYSTKEVKLTPIGKFGIMRKPRPNVPAHYHTGIDLMRPGNNYECALVFPASEGTVISKREDGPYAQIIIEHKLENKIIWSVYEHIAGIEVQLYDHVDPNTPIARFMNRNELNKHGWQFDHIHFELLKVAPIPVYNDTKNPQRKFRSHSLKCYTEEELYRYFYNPLEFLKLQFRD